MKIFKSKALIGEHNIGIRGAKPLRLTKEHTHDYIEIVYIKNGTATEYVDGTGYSVRRGDVIFMTPNSVHSFEPCENFEHVEIFFSPRLIGEEVITAAHTLTLLALTSFDKIRHDQSYGLVRFDGDEIREVEYILDSMQREFDYQEEGYEAYMCNCLNMLLIKMVRATSGSAEVTEVWDALEEYIDRNSDKRITLSAIASKCFYNPSYFSRIFKQRYGMTLTDYLKRKRIEKAKALLTETLLTVDQVIEKVGFTDRSAFYSSFSEIVGCTPAEYRAYFKK